MIISIYIFIYIYVYTYIYMHKAACPWILVLLLDFTDDLVEICLGRTREHAATKDGVAKHVQHAAIQPLVAAQVFVMHELWPETVTANAW